MFRSFIDFADLLLAALTVGTMFCVWLVFNPAGLDPRSYIALQQHAIRTLNRSVPALGATTILLTIVAAVLSRNDRARMTLLICCLLCLLAAGLVTRFLNQPINAIVITWHADSPPVNWTNFRDRWWRWHCVRLAAGMVGLSALITSMLRPNSVQ